jgi:hypothetical protein
MSLNVGVPVQECEGERAGQPQRPVRQRIPEGEEGLAEGDAVRPVLAEEGPVHLPAEGVFVEGPHRLGEVLLAAVAPVQTAHRHPYGPGQFLGLHVLIAMPAQHLRRALHHPREVMLREPHPLPPPAPLPGRPSRGRNITSTIPFYRRGLTWRIGRGGPSLQVGRRGRGRLPRFREVAGGTDTCIRAHCFAPRHAQGTGAFVPQSQEQVHAHRSAVLRPRAVVRAKSRVPVSGASHSPG